MRWKGVEAMCGMGKRAGDSWEEILSHAWRWEKLVWKVVSIYFSHSITLIANSLFPWCSCFQFFFLGCQFFSERITSFSSGRKNVAFLFVPWRSLYYDCLTAMLGYHKEYWQQFCFCLDWCFPPVFAEIEKPLSTLCTGLPPTLLLWALKYWETKPTFWEIL